MQPSSPSRSSPPQGREPSRGSGSPGGSGAPAPGAAPAPTTGPGRERPIRVSVAGATGYAGGELLRWLRAHPAVEIHRLASRRWAERSVDDAWPALRGMEGRILEETDPEALADGTDAVLLAVPHGVGMELVPSLLEREVRVVDLSADFRLRDPAAYARWYGRDHLAPTLLDEAVYGLPELNRSALGSARLVANPGCYPTAVAVALAPLAGAGWVQGTVSVDAKSGASGAGRSPAPNTTFVEVNESVRPYGVGEHRHTPEMEQTLADAGLDVGVFFTPHLVPMSRGLLACCHFRLDPTVDPEEIGSRYRTAYAGEPFVRLLEEELPATRNTVGSNFCDVAVRVDAGRGVGVAMAALDNLGKGAAGQAVQCLNAMFGLDEKEGLWSAPTFP